MRALKAALLAVALLGWPAAAQPAGPFRVEPWIQDLDQLRDAMSARYPNLEWQAARGLDLKSTYELARQRLTTANDEAGARRAFELFLRRFGDGHLSIEWPRPRTLAQTAAPSTAPLCSRLGYFDVGDAGAIATRLPGFRAVGAEDSPLPAGVAESNGKRVGVLRVPLFDPHGFPSICERLMAQERLTPESPCDDACQDRLSRRADAIFTEDMARQLQALADASDVLVLDIAQNGGGNDSSLVLARMLSAGTLASPPVGFVRTPEWAAELAYRQEAVREALRTARGEPRKQLAEIDRALGAARAEAGESCDRSGLWRSEPIGCSLVVVKPLFAGGLLPEPPHWARGAPWAEVVSATARFPQAAPVWRGPLVVLVDGATASSSELIAAMLQDSAAATIVGSPTFGAGCGHMTAAGPVRLANSGGEVSMPDCLRLRADGTNEVAGVQPDVLIGFRASDTPKERVARLARAMPEILRRALSD